MNDKFKVSDRFKKSLEEFDRAIAEIEETERKIEAMGTDLVKHYNDAYRYSVLPVDIDGQTLSPQDAGDAEEEDLTTLPHAGGWMGNCPVVDDYDKAVKRHTIKYGVDPDKGKNHTGYYGPLIKNTPESFPDALECEHDPIDVGFAKPKMVCKKCDKDL
jgi:hypothetical protein